MKPKPKPEPPRKCCRDCWHAAGTQRQSGRKVVQRVCRLSGLWVTVSTTDHCCAEWQPRKSNAIIALKANLEAINRVHPELSEEAK